MRLNNDFDSDKNNSPVVILTGLGVVLFAIVLVLFVVFFNLEKQETPKQSKEEVIVEDGQSYFPQVIYPEVDELVGSEALRPDDLDFWDLYPQQEEESVPVPEPEEVSQETETDPSTDGRHTRIVNEKGEDEWVLISPNLPKHSYDFLNLVNQSGLMKYCPEGTETSFVGADLSESQDYVDFGKVKKAGIDFVILRLGGRGYSTGELFLDDYFVDNERRAAEAGMDVGVYFFSQAISEEEAREEAEFVITNLNEKKITYPVALDMGKVQNDSQRTDSLTKTQRTKIAKTFLSTIKEAGYKPILYGTKNFLIQDIDYSKLTEYDIWLSQETDIPDYPYRFTLWQYTKRASIDGIAGYVNLNLSFVDYKEK